MNKTKKRKFIFLGIALNVCALFMVQVQPVAAADWEYVGNAGFSVSDADYTALAIHPTSFEPYVAYQDQGVTNKIMVKRFNGTSWVTVGSGGISQGTGRFTDMAMNPSNGQPFVVYQDYANGYRLTVRRFDGTNWVDVGPAGFTPVSVGVGHIAINPSTNEPYVTYADSGVSGKATMMRFDGTNWVYVGVRGFSGGNGGQPTLAFDPTTFEPYVAYQDGASSGKATVQKFNGTSWSVVGTAGFSPGAANYPTIAINPVNHELFVVFRDITQSSNGTVMKYDGSSWNYVGTPGIASAAGGVAIEFNPINNMPYILLLGGYPYVRKWDGSNWQVVGTDESFYGNGFMDNGFGINPSTGAVYVASADSLQSMKMSVWSNADAVTPLAITGVADGEYYYDPVTPGYTGGVEPVSGTLNSLPFMFGTEIGDDNVYTLTATDDASTQAQVTFTVRRDITIINPDGTKILNAFNDRYMTIPGSDPEATPQATFKVNHTFIDNSRGVNAQLYVPRDTVMTRTGGGNLSLSGFGAQDITRMLQQTEPGLIAGGIKIGIDNVRLNFSHDVTVTIPVGASYNGQTLEVAFRNEGETTWTTDGTTCTVTDGNCVFATSHATQFKVGPGPLEVSETAMINLDLDAIISLACTDTVSMGTITGYGKSNLASNSATCNVRTNNSGGYKLEWQASVADMESQTTPGDTFAAYNPALADTPETWNVPSASSGWGARLSTASTTDNTGTWGADDQSGTNYGTTARWLNVKQTAPFQIVQRGSETTHAGDDEVILFGAEIGSSKIQPNGTYAVDVTMTATTL